MEVAVYAPHDDVPLDDLAAKVKAARYEATKLFNRGQGARNSLEKEQRFTHLVASISVSASRHCIEGLGPGSQKNAQKSRSLWEITATIQKAPGYDSNHPGTGWMFLLWTN